MHTRVKLLGDANADYTQIIGGGYSQIIGGIYIPIPPPGFDTPVDEKMKQRQTNVEETDLWETIIREKHKTKPGDTPSVYAVSLWYWYKPKARQEFLPGCRTEPEPEP